MCNLIGVSLPFVGPVRSYSILLQISMAFEIDRYYTYFFLNFN